MLGSLRNKIKNIREGEKIIIFPKKDYKTLMQNIGAEKSKGHIKKEIKYKKAVVIIDDKLFIGVAVYHTAAEQI